MFILQNPKDLFYFAHKCEATPPTDCFYGHTHGHCEVLFFVRGNASFNIEGKIFKLSPLDIVLIPPRHYHCLILDDLSPYERYVLEIPLLRCPPGSDAVFESPRIFSIAENKSLIGIFERAEAYYTLLPPDDFERSAALLAEECLLLLKADLHAGTTSHSYDPLTLRLLRFINANLSEPLTVAGLAEHFFLSKSHIQNVFLRNMRIGIKSYIVQKKMALAKDLLAHGEQPSEVAAHLGYDDYTTFYKNFKKHCKESPRTFLGKFREKAGNA